MNLEIPPTLSDAIFSLCPSAAFVIEDPQDIETLRWLIPKEQHPSPDSDKPFVGVVDQDAERWWDNLPSNDQILDEFKRINDEFNARQYARNRMYEYPDIGDQLDALFHAGVFPEEMAAQIQAVKDKYPKPSGN